MPPESGKQSATRLMGSRTRMQIKNKKAWKVFAKGESISKAAQKKLADMQKVRGRYSKGMDMQVVVGTYKTKPKSSGELTFKAKAGPIQLARPEPKNMTVPVDKATPSALYKTGSALYPSETDAARMKPFEPKVYSHERRFAPKVRFKRGH